MKSITALLELQHEVSAARPQQAMRLQAYPAELEVLKAFELLNSSYVLDFNLRFSAKQRPNGSPITFAASQPPHSRSYALPRIHILSFQLRSSQFHNARNVSNHDRGQHFLLEGQRGRLVLIW